MFVKAKNAKSVTIPATITLNGKKYKKYFTKKNAGKKVKLY